MKSFELRRFGEFAAYDPPQTHVVADGFFIRIDDKTWMAAGASSFAVGQAVEVRVMAGTFFSSTPRDRKASRALVSSGDVHQVWVRTDAAEVDELEAAE